MKSYCSLLSKGKRLEHRVVWWRLETRDTSLVKTGDTDQLLGEEKPLH